MRAGLWVRSFAIKGNDTSSTMTQRTVITAVLAVLLLKGCGTVTAVTDGIGGVFYGVSDDIRSVRDRNQR